MSKKNKKVNKNKKENEKELFKQQLKWFTRATCDILNNELKDVKLEDIISGIFLKSDDEQVQKLIKMYEKQLILFKLDNEKFIKTIHKFYMDTNKYLKTNMLYDKFFKLVHLFYTENILIKDNVKNKIQNAYVDLLLQQYSYFGGRADTNIYGVSTKGKLFYLPEYIRGYTDMGYSQKLVVDDKMTMSEYINLINKYGINDMKELIMKDGIFSNQEKTISGMMFQLAYFIDETNKDIYPERNEFFRNPTDFFEMNPVFTKKYDVVDKIKEKLVVRNRTLPSSGVVASIQNCEDIKEVYLKEVFRENRIILLFRVKFKDDKYALGFYDSVKKSDYTPWKITNAEKLLNNPLINLVLQLYLELTCEFDSEKEKRKYLYIFHENDSVINEIPKGKFIIPIVNYKYLQSDNKDEAKNIIDRKNIGYDTEIRNINYFTRKLPKGWKTSDEAKSLARQYGIELREGETFVKGFVKKVHISK